MRIETVQWLRQFEEKVNVKHRLTRSEVEEVLFNRPSVVLWNMGTNLAKTSMQRMVKHLLEDI
jgi:hypothetical protein